MRLLLFCTTLPIVLVGCSGEEVVNVEPDAKKTSFVVNELYVGTSQELQDIYFSDDNNGWAVGAYGVVVHTTNGGHDWLLQSSGQVGYLYGLHFINPETAWVVGMSGTLLRTEDGGNLWTDTSIVAQCLMDVYRWDDYRGWAVGDSIILKTTDHGCSWDEFSYEGVVVPRLYAVWFATESRGWAVGERGCILHTENSGSQWFPQTSHVTNPLLDVAFVDASRGWAVGVGGMILHTDDGGQNWSEQMSAVDVNLRGVAFQDADNGVVVGEQGVLLTTSDGGANWSSRDSGTDEILWSVCYSSASTFWVASDDGVVLKVTERSN